MLLNTAAAIRQGVSILNLEIGVQKLREMQRQQLIAKGAIAADPEDIVGVDIIDDDDVIEANEVDELPEPEADTPPNPDESETEPARQAA